MTKAADSQHHRVRLPGGGWCTVVVPVAMSEQDLDVIRYLFDAVLAIEKFTPATQPKGDDDE